MDLFKFNYNLIGLYGELYIVKNLRIVEMYYKNYEYLKGDKQ